MQTINTNITTGLVVIVLALLSYLLLLSLRRPVLAKLRLRNTPRRPTQSMLIVLGLTLSTIIIVAALSTGDTLSYSLRRQAVGAYGQIDEIIAPPCRSVCPSVLKTNDVVTLAVVAAHTTSHLHAWQVELTRPASREEVLAAFRAVPRIAFLQMADGQVALNSTLELTTGGSAFRLPQSATLAVGCVAHCGGRLRAKG